MSSADYTAASSLTYLEGLDAVRKRPGMYIGSTDSRGLIHCLWEIIDNSVDEAIGGHAKEITVTLFGDGSFGVTDDGRGIPVDIEPKSGLSGVELVYTKLHAGGKFGGGGYAVSGGLHGVGASVVNALSTRLDVEVDRGGVTHALSFHHGEAGAFDAKGKFTPGSTLRKVGKVGKDVTGTRVRYWPDMDIFLDGATVDLDLTYARARQTAFLVPGLAITVIDERKADAVTTERFCFEGGVRDFVDYRAGTRQERPLSDTLVLNGTGKFTERVPVLNDGKTVLTDVERDVEVDIALRWGVGYDTDVISFVNIISTPKGGTHLAGFERAMVKVLNEQLKGQRVQKATDDAVIKDDVLEGLTAVVTVRLAEPQFEGQTKEVLGTRDVAGIVANVAAEQLEKYFTDRRTKPEARRVLEKVAQAAKTRQAARELKETKRRKTALESASMPSKLVDCRSEDMERAELFIVEGDSALGTFKQGRDSDFQAALPIRGKILNTLRATEKQMLGNAECAAIIQVMGAGSGRSFDMSGLRYGKLIFLTDADVDGAHIRCLLLTLVYKYMRPLLEAGRVYSAVPPLHRIELAGVRNEDEKYIYTYSDDELKDQLVKLEKAGKKVKDDGIQRYKGLGEMDADQLSETTLAPDKRVLRRCTIDEGQAASDMFDICMGPDVAIRKDFIFTFGGDLDAELIDA